MVIGLGENKANGRRAIIVTLNEHDVLRLIAEGIVLSADAHQGFPADLELCLACAPDAYVEETAIHHHPNVQRIPQTRES